jgi:MoxR-like ATPase
VSAPAPADLDRLSADFARLKAALARAVVGQEETVEQLLVALLARGHALLVGVPGLAKTLLVSSLAQALDLTFSRVQFTPDLMPSDVTGSDVLQEDPVTRERRFVFAKGPVFAHVLLADEINRTPPKTQAALLQAMQEGQVTAAGRTHALPHPFFVLATQNPIEQEGTYPLPEAQLDRFLLQVNVSYPSEEEERRIVAQTTRPAGPAVEKVLSAEALVAHQALVRQAPAPDNVVEKAVRLARLTRPSEPGAPDFVRQNVSWGAGPRAAQALILGAKARCLLQGRAVPSWEDVAALAAPVLRHRLVLSFRAESDGLKPDDLVRKLLES